jgi:hypothetical protein
LVRTLSAIASEVADQARVQLDAFKCVRVGAGLAQETGDPSGQATVPRTNILERGLTANRWLAMTGDLVLLAICSIR